MPEPSLMNKLSLPVLCFWMLAAACKVVPSTISNNYNYIQKAGREDQTWKLVWEDNFDGQTLDTTKWTKIPPIETDWGRHMTSDPRCYAIDSGKLYLRGIVNPDTTLDPR